MAFMSRKPNRRLLFYAIHAIGWGILFSFPLVLRWRTGDEPITLLWYAGYVFAPLSFMIVFYANYGLLIPRQLFRKRWGAFAGTNLLLIAGIWYAGHLWRTFYMDHLAAAPHTPPPDGFLPPAVFIARDMMLFLLTVALAVAIKMTLRWQQSEAQRGEAERRRTEAELSNLKNQLNPHFLFNTLNNIYSLIDIDSTKAQSAVHELSRLLRYVLYEGVPTAVPLEKELNFLRNYISLMSLRTGPHVRRHIDLSCRDPKATVAPLIFISLVENAFKHGVSSTKSSFIDISISTTDDGHIACRISNSDFPKDDSDRSGSGIGLTNLERRLRLIYGPGHYNFSCTAQDGTYHCQLLIPAHL